MLLILSSTAFFYDSTSLRTAFSFSLRSCYLWASDTLAFLDPVPMAVGPYLAWIEGAYSSLSVLAAPVPVLIILELRSRY